VASTTQALGAAHEATVAKLLQNDGLIIVARNFRCKMGEIDIVASRERALHFVEVRYRRDDRYGDGADSVTIAKQAKLKRSAKYFLHCNPEYHSFQCQFDVVSITGTNSPYDIDWISDAFS